MNDKTKEQLEEEQKKIQAFNEDYLKVCQKHNITLRAGLDVNITGITPRLLHVDYAQEKKEEK